MRIKKLELKNFRGFEDLTIDFPEGESGLAVFVGVNGSGKTSVLEGIVALLRTIVNDLMPNEKNRKIITKIAEDDIRLTPHQMGSQIDFEMASEYQLSAILERNSKDIKVHFKDNGGNFEQVNELTQELKIGVNRKKLFELPLFAYYKSTRFWTQEKIKPIIPLPNFSRFYYYDDCLEPEISSKTILEWYRRMDDIFKINIDGLPPELKDVNDAITQCLNSMLQSSKPSRVRFDRLKEKLIIQNSDETHFEFRQLSEGFRNLVGLVFDVAYRASELNPHIRNKTSGIVIIDDIDLHLHPSWQRKVVPTLQQIFPNIQFILTTHSPQVLSNVPRENVFILNDFKLEKNKPHTEGRDSNAILEDIFDVPSRPEEEKSELDALFDAIEKGDKEKAQQLHDGLKKKLGDRDIELQRAENYMELLID